MKVEQIYTGCLAEAAYYIESNGEAIIIDPLREVEPYIKKAEANGAKIKYVLETHFHADFVSGHIDLSKKTGAPIVFGPNAQPSYEAHIAEDGEIFKVGNAQIKVLHTPGHTMESTTYLLIDEDGNDHAIFTGDTLFIGDVGRPDLAVKTTLTQEDLAGHLYDSLHNKILTLADEVIVYPGHGAGSACGKMMSDETTDTLGNQKKTNYALQAKSKEDFVKQVTDGLMPPPQYFPKNVMLNKGGYESIDVVMDRANKALSPDEFEEVANSTGALMLDTRHEDDFGPGHVPNSINIGLNGSFAVWVGTLVPELDQPILVIAPEGQEEETVIRLSRVGYDNVVGYLNGGFKTWKDSGKDYSVIDSVTAEEFATLVNEENVNVIDVRKQSEHDSEHVIGATCLPLDYVNDYMDKFPKEEKTYLHCAGGYRSMTTASILQSRGYNNFVNVMGGFDAIKETNAPVSEYVCPTTLL